MLFSERLLFFSFSYCYNCTRSASQPAFLNIDSSLIAWNRWPMKIETLFAFIVLALCLSNRSPAAPQYRITTLGFNDIEHTDGFGRAFTRPGDLNDAGQV